MRSLFFVGITLLVMAGCSVGDDVLGTSATAEPTQIAEPAPTTDTTQASAIEIAQLLDNDRYRDATVRGFVVWNDASARVCEVLAESFPPQCGGLSITIANPQVLDVAFETEAAVRWTQGSVTIEGFFDGNQFIVKDPAAGGPGGTTNGVAGEPSIEDQALVDAFLGFVADPTLERFDQLHLSESVGLGLGDEITNTQPAEALLDPANWMISRDEFRAWSGPFSALRLAEPPVIITVGPHMRCAAEPVPAPPGFADHRRVSLQSENASSCLEWWTVDFFVDASGQIEAITLDLFAP